MSPKDQFLTRTRNYVSFAESHEALFHVMFDELDKGDPKVRESAVKTYLALREVVRPLLGDADAARGELAVWAMTHGYVSLRLGQPRPSSAPFQAINMVDLLTTLIPSLNLTEPT
ncbi:TetR-like C-terminal domain-containing protein [Paracoccus sp. (in: a-proteobacteria)]|uniref:TetR-like C-terminal domain-containing protein n=1 Tax=Paracoccus sp. TaxID=267 RepID=UPI0026DF9D34|nr:TetR-like C-terminal domain-containing protein [Paracoccus sp. (in: a-proteobacteria)]MDO5648137.1 TetR-like C-terminal domain-containing protein [Paracoccus sp. (in: a-proteobacteria)]